MQSTGNGDRDGGPRHQHQRADLPAALVPERARGEESDLPLEHLGPVRQLRRLGRLRADQLGGEVRPGGVGGIISSYTPVHVRGRIMVHYAMIDDDNKIAFWRQVGERVHQYGCRFIMQLSHSGRQQDQGGVENEYLYAQSSTSKPDTFHGIVCKAMSHREIQETVGHFAEGARRAHEAGLDGVELHGANGYLITQFLSSGINDRKDEYGGPLKNRYRFVHEIIGAIREKVGPTFHLQLKISAEDHGNACIPGKGRATRSTSRSNSASGPRRTAWTRSTSPRATRFRTRPTRRATGRSSTRRGGTTRCSRRGSTPDGCTSC